MSQVVETAERYRFIRADPQSSQNRFAYDVQTGLLSTGKSLPCRYFYDEEGSRLFQAICELPEYYLTRVEHRILEDCAGDLAAAFPEPLDLIELGSGNSLKTRLLLQRFLNRPSELHYVPIDISHRQLYETSHNLIRDYAALEITAVAADYLQGLQSLNGYARRRKLIVWLGSSIGNLERDEAANFLRQVRLGMAPQDRLLVGIDLQKSRRLLESAYNDKSGVTARFNRNILNRINRELRGFFNAENFQHRIFYNSGEDRIELSLVSAVEQVVPIFGIGLEFAFAKGEPIRTEYCHKYSISQIHCLAHDAGLCIERQWRDEKNWFSVNLLAPR